MKTWYLSKTLWLNLIAVIVLLFQTRYGFVIDPEAQAGLLAVINLILRAITKEPLAWNPATSPADGGFIRLPLLFLIAAFACIVALAGCAGFGSAQPTAAPVANDSPQVLAGKSLLAVKSTIVVAATSADTLCKNGTMAVDKCAQAKTAYEKVKPAYDAAVDAYLLMTSVGGDSGNYGRALTRVQELAADLLAVSGGAQ